ncbi:hypothetical protein HMPREF3191_00914 [Veillonellaceae bacterium DNF00626]|nr:hypothetical protein HMPREF3191_00914 [Veillonellaceae bacterium DNF00626]
MYHRYRLNRGVLHKADREIPWYIVSRYFSFAPEIITPSNHKKQWSLYYYTTIF